MALHVNLGIAAIGPHMELLGPRMVERGLHQHGRNAPPAQRLRHAGVGEHHHLAEDAVLADAELALDGGFEARGFDVVLNLHCGHRANCCHKKLNSSAIMSARCLLSAAPPWPPSMFS